MEDPKIIEAAIKLYVWLDFSDENFEKPESGQWQDLPEEWKQEYIEVAKKIANILGES